MNRFGELELSTPTRPRQGDKIIPRQPPRADAVTLTIAAHFDDTAIVPDQPVELPTGRPLRVSIEFADAAPPKFAADLPDAPVDLASRHDDHQPAGDR